MRKKKLLLLVLSCIMVLSFAACGKEATPPQKVDAYAEFTKIQKEMKEMKDAEFHIALNMDNGKSQESKNLKASMDGQMVKTTKDKYELKLECKNDSDLESTTYLKDDHVYIDIEGDKLKEALGSELAKLFTVDIRKYLDIDKSMVVDSAMKNNGDNTIFVFKLDPGKAFKYLQNPGNGTPIEILGDMESTKVHNLGVTINAGNDHVVNSIKIASKMVTIEDNKEYPLNFNMKLTYVSTNTGLKIQFPDLSQYEKMNVGL